MTITGISSCSRYCWGPIHIHPQSENLSHDLWMMSQSVIGLPGFFEAVASHSTPPQPLTERIIDNIFLGFMGFSALAASPVVIAGAGLAYAGEKLLDAIEVVPRIRVKVEAFGRALNEQKQIIEAFGPLLDLADKVAVINKKTIEKTEKIKERISELGELETNYPANADLLERVEKMITRLESDLPTKISQQMISGLKEKNLVGRIEILKQVAEEEAHMKALALRLKALMESVGKKAEALHQMESRMTELTHVKEEQIDGLKKDAAFLIVQAQQTTSNARIQDGVVVV